MIGPIGPEERKAIDAHLALRLAQHRIVAVEKPRPGPGQCRPFVFGAVTKPERVGRKYTPSPEHVERLRPTTPRAAQPPAPASTPPTSRIKLKFAFLKSLRCEPLPRPVWPPPDRAIPTMVTVKGETKRQLRGFGSHGELPTGRMGCGRTSW